MSAYSAVAAVAVNSALFLQSGAQTLGPGEFQDEVVSFVQALLPGTVAARPSPSTSPIVVTGAS